MRGRLFCTILEECLPRGRQREWPVEGATMGWPHVRSGVVRKFSPTWPQRARIFIRIGASCAHAPDAPRSLGPARAEGLRPVPGAPHPSTSAGWSAVARNESSSDVELVSLCSSRIVHVVPAQGRANSRLRRTISGPPQEQAPPDDREVPASAGRIGVGRNYRSG